MRNKLLILLLFPLSLMGQNTTINLDPSDTITYSGTIRGTIDLDKMYVETETEPELVEVFDSIFWNSVDISDSTRNSFSEFVFDYSGTELQIGGKTTLTSQTSLDAKFNQLTIYIDGVYYDTLIYGTNEVLRDVTLPTGNKRVTIVEGAGAVPQTPTLGTWLTSLKVDTSKYTKAIYSVGGEKIVFLVNSIGVGDRTTLMADQAWTRMFKTESGKDIAVYGWGSYSVFKAASNSVKYDSTADRIDRLLAQADTQKVVISLGTNDYGLSHLTPNDFATYYAYLINAIHAQNPNAVIYCISPIYRHGETSDLQTYRNKIDSICISKDGYALCINGLNILSYPTDYYDEVHPDIYGTKKFKDYVYPIINHVFDEDAINLINKMDYNLNADQMLGIDSMMVMLKDSGIYSGSDIIYVFNVADSSDAGINWTLNTADTLTAVGGIDFTAKSGYLSTATDGYLNTKWTPSVDAVKYTLDDASVSIFSSTDVQQNYYDFGVNTTNQTFAAIRYATNRFYGQVNSTTVPYKVNTSSIGLFTIEKFSHDSLAWYVNGIDIGHAKANATALPAKNLYICNNNNDGTLAANSTTRRYSFFRTGNKLGNDGNRRLYNTLTWWNAKVAAIF